jgi:hypothetical protein
MALTYECPQKSVNAQEAFYYHQHFITLSEQTLDKVPEGKDECYRVFQLGVLINPSVAFFFVRDGKYLVRYKNITNCSWMNKEAKVVTREAEITESDWKKIRSLLWRLDFWNLNSYQQLNQSENPWDIF